VLIDEFRAGGDLAAPVNRKLLEHGGESLIVPAAATGEFLDGAAMISEERFQQTMRVLRSRKVAVVDLDTAEHYGRISAELRKRKKLAGRSSNDIWIAATALAHGARLLTRNTADFAEIPGPRVLGYG
jgi:hypothetical protein